VWPDATRYCDLTCRGVSPVSTTYANIGRLSEHDVELAIGTSGRVWSTHPVIKKSLGNLTRVDLTWLGSALGRGSGTSGYSVLAVVERASGRWGTTSGRCHAHPIATWLIAWEFSTVGIAWTRLNRGAMCRASHDRTLGGMRPVIPIYVSGRCADSCSKRGNDSIHGALYLSPMAGSSSLSWPFALTKQPCELSQSLSTHLHHWFIIFVRLGENPSALLEWLHLEAHGVRVSLRVSLVTLGGYHHLDGLE
jgi:hypothetical protein